MGARMGRGGSGTRWGGGEAKTTAERGARPRHRCEGILGCSAPRRIGTFLSHNFKGIISRIQGLNPPGIFRGEFA